MVKKHISQGKCTFWRSKQASKQAGRQAGKHASQPAGKLAFSRSAAVRPTQEEFGGWGRVPSQLKNSLTFMFAVGALLG